MILATSRMHVLNSKILKIGKDLHSSPLSTRCNNKICTFRKQLQKIIFEKWYKFFMTMSLKGTSFSSPERTDYNPPPPY